MPYPYGMYNAPTVGNGLGGLPRRTTAVVPTPTPTTTYAKYSPILNTQVGNANGFKVLYNNVLTDIVGSNKSSGNFASNRHASMRSYPMFTFDQELTGGGGSMFPAGYQTTRYVDPNFVSVTFGGESNYNSYTYIWSFASDYLYRARSASQSTSPQFGFSVDGDSSNYYILASGVISIINKTSLTATVTKSYSGASTLICGWVYGDNLHSLDTSGRLLIVNKDTLEVVSVFNTGVSTPSTGLSQSFAQNSSLVAWTNTTRTYVFVLNKATLEVKAFTIPWVSGTGLYTNFFPCGNKIIGMLFETGTTPYATYVYEFDADRAYPIVSIDTNNYGEGSVSSSGCFFGSDILSIANLVVSPQPVPTSALYWNIKPSEFTSSSVIPTFSGYSVTNLRGSSTAMSVYAKTSTTSTATNSTNTFTTFVKYPYVVNY